MTVRAIIPLGLTCLALLYYYCVELITVIQLVKAVGGANYSIVFLVQPVMWGYLLWKALTGPKTALTIFILVSLVLCIKKLWHVGSHPMEPFYFSAYVALFLSSAWWKFTNYRIEKSDERQFGLCSLSMLKLKEPIEKAFDLYGQPKETTGSDRNANATTYTFAVGDSHEVVVTEWNGIVHSITYWSAISFPRADLKHMLREYSEGVKWSLLERGYWYQRQDGERRLWCSAAPAIGVGTVEFLSSKRSESL